MSGPGLLTEAECEALTRRVLERVRAAAAEVRLISTVRATTRFARGVPQMASEVAETACSLAVEVGGRHAMAQTNQVDDAGLRALVAEAEALAREDRTPETWEDLLPRQRYPEGLPIYFDTTTTAMAAEPQATLVAAATAAAAAAGLVAAGDLQLEGVARAVRNTSGLVGYERATYGEFSVTARSTEHRSSGWAWSGFEDWSRVDTAGVIRRAVELGRRSADPVAVEPGRYAVILEPAAVAALLEPILTEWDAYSASRGLTVFAKEPIGTNKIGLQMLDRRLGMVADPHDPDRPASTKGRGWVPLGPVVWFEEGVLRNLAYDPWYARQVGRRAVFDPGGVRLTADGPPTSLEDMIATTKRGIWVNRLSHVTTMNRRTLLLTGTTRDGTFLIENGKITKPIKNFRFTESPFFVLNKLEAWGEPVRASRPVVAPRLLLRDFHFTSLTEAV